MTEHRDTSRAAPRGPNPSRPNGARALPGQDQEGAAAGRTARPAPALYAASDLHVGHRQNRAFVESITPAHPGDWLIVAGDVAEDTEDVCWALGLLAERYATVVWVPGNHELWTTSHDALRLCGDRRYRHLVDACRELGVLTPEDPYPVWEGAGGPVRVAPLFLLYDYSFHPPGTSTKEEGLAYAHRTGIVCTDEYLLEPDPYPSRDAWCRARVTYTEGRLLDVADPATPFVLVNHFPLVRTPTDVLRYPEFAQWCGTTATADWHVRFPTAVAVYGHLHIPRSTVYDGVPFEEVSLGYPRERRDGMRRPVPRRVLPRERNPD